MIIGPAGPLRQRYAIVMPCRNEELFIANTLASVCRQTVPPAICVVVDDGSSDRTASIADGFARDLPWLRVIRRADRGTRKLGGGVVDAFYSGYETLDLTAIDYICKLDADLTLQETYFERLLQYMEEDQHLGAASGKVFNCEEANGRIFEERIIDEQVAGCAKFYRKTCFKEIGGFVREVMWDGIDFHRCRMLGWKTRSFADVELRILHHRLMGSSHKSIFHGRLRWGAGQWFMGTHPLYILASGVYRMREKPFITGGLCIIAGYLLAMIKGRPRYEEPEFRRSLRQWQLRRLRLGYFSKTPSRKFRK